MQNLILALTIFGLGYFGLTWLRKNFPRLITRHGHIASGLALIAIAILAGAKGAAWLSGPLGSVGLWMLWSAKGAGTGQSGGFGGMGGGGQGRAMWPFGGRGATQRVTTDFLDIERDSATGAMRGRVLKGFFKGRGLERMRPVELAHLWQDCRMADPRSAEMIEQFLDHLHPSWREDLAKAEAQRGPDGTMPADEALEILGLEPGAGVDDIRRAHRELMLKLHPDRGGSTYLAAKINQAKDVLLARKG